MEDTVTGETVKKRLAILRGSCCNVSWGRPSPRCLDVSWCSKLQVATGNFVKRTWGDPSWWNLTYKSCNYPTKMAKYDRSLEFPFHYYEDPWCNVYLVEDWWSGEISNDFNQIFLWQLDIPAFRAWQMFKKEAMHCKARAWFEGHSKRKARCSFFILVGLPRVQGYTDIQTISDC